MTEEGTLLAGRIRYRQRRDGHRTGLEPVLLAATVPARPGEHVIEGGTGAGAGLLCLLHRLPRIRATGLEAAPELAALARENLALNDLGGRADMAETTLPALPPSLAPAHHAFANPPWFDRTGTTPALPARRLARTLPSDAARLAWTAGLGRAVIEGGTLGLIVPAGSHDAWRTAMREGGFGAVSLVPLWPHAGQDARIVILQGRRTARGPDRVAPGLVLHETGGGFTAAANAILREGAAFPGLG